MSVDERVKNLEEMWKKMDAIHKERDGEVAADEGFSIKEYAEKYNLNFGQAEGRLRRLVNNGKLLMGHRISKTGRTRERVFRFP